MTLDVTQAANRIVECLTDDGMILPKTAFDALLAATTTVIVMWAKDDPVIVAEKFGEVLADMVGTAATDFPEHLKVGMLQ
ncbi:MAG: hypothetical protein WA975_21625 [Mesorhizobium sp.]